MMRVKGKRWPTWVVPASREVVLPVAFSANLILTSNCKVLFSCYAGLASFKMMARACNAAHRLMVLGSRLSTEHLHITL
jgi:hypothetical protein